MYLTCQELVRIISSKIDVLVDEAIPTLAVGSVDSYLKYLDKVTLSYLLTHSFTYLYNYY